MGAWDALKAFVQFGIRAPISPVSKTEPDVIAGRALFTAANCQQCHGGAPVDEQPGAIHAAAGRGADRQRQIIGELRKVGNVRSHVVQ